MPVMGDNGPAGPLVHKAYPKSGGGRDDPKYALGAPQQALAQEQEQPKGAGNLPEK